MKKVNENAIEVSRSEGKVVLDRTEIRKFNALVQKTNVEHPKPKDVQAARQKAHATEKRADELVVEFEKMVQVLTRAYLIAQGCHTHKGQWRRKREKSKKERD